MSTIAVLSHIVIDEIHPANGGPVVANVGGAGAFAAVGASLAGDSGTALLVSGIGTHDRATLVEWCGDREISSKGLFDAGAHSPRTRIHYFADGEREETPMFGLDHFNSYTPLPVNIPVHFEDLGGAYLFHDLDTTYWERIDEFRGKFSSPILWEISAEACRPENRDAVLERLPLVDVLSINEAEAFSLLAVNALPDVVAALRGASVMVLLRLGARGSIVLGGGRPVRIGTAPTHAADPTGGGNAYSGAFLTSFAQTGDHAAAGTVAAAAASVVVANPGSPKVTTAIRSAVQHAATKVSVVPILD